jgi:hypothetical protein
MTGDDATPALSDEPLLVELLAYWEAKRGGRDVPEKRSIDPAEIAPRLLPFIAISELEAGGRIRYRLVGTGIAERHGIDPTGKYLNDVLQGAYRDYILGLHFECALKRRPLYAEALSRRADGAYFRAKRLILPLTDGGVEIRFIAAGQIFLSPNAQNDREMRWYQSAGELRELARTVL